MGHFSQRKIVKALALAALSIYIYQKRDTFFTVVTVFLYAAAFTLILSPLCKTLEKRGFRPSLAAAMCILLFLLTAGLILAAFLPYLVSHSVDLVRRITPTLTHLLAQGSALLAQFGITIANQAGVTDMIASAASQLTAALARGSVAFATQAGQIAFSLVVAYYLLCERVQIGNHLQLLLPITWRTAFLCAMLGCRNAVLSYLSGVLKTSVFVALATFAGLFMLGVRDALLLAVFMGIFEILPYIGPVLAAIPIVLATLGQGFYQALFALGVVIVVQQIEGNFISPFFTASSTSIHPLAALVSVFVLGSLLGLWGILLAVPIVVTLRSVLWSMRQVSNMMKT